MDNEHKIEYEGYSIHIYRDKKKLWHVSALHDGESAIVREGRDRDTVVDNIQYAIDLRVAAKDKTEQVSKAGLWNWLNDKTV